MSALAVHVLACLALTVAVGCSVAARQTKTGAEMAGTFERAVSETGKACLDAEAELVAAGAAALPILKANSGGPDVVVRLYLRDHPTASLTEPLIRLVSPTLETAMNEPTSADPAPLRNVTLMVDNRPVVITPADAEEIARALQRYLDAHQSTDDGTPLPRAAGQPWLDSRGTLRIGSWMLGSRGDRLVLTLRDAPQPGATSGYQFIGLVARAKDGWQVPSVGVSRIQYR